MGANPDQLTEEIAATRDRMSHTTDEIRTRVAPSEVMKRRSQSAVRSVRDAGSSVGESAGEAAEEAASMTRRISDTATGALRDQPLLTGLAAFGAGLLVGALAPASDTEQRATQKLQRDLQEPIQEAAADSARQIGETVREQADEAVEHVRDEAQSATREVRDHVGEAAGDVRDRVETAGEHVRDDVVRDVEQRTGG